MILENPSFLAFISFAADVPFETWIMPKRHHPDFGQITQAEKDDLAQALHVLLARLARKLHDPDYNYVLIPRPAWPTRLRITGMSGSGPG